MRLRRLAVRHFRKLDGPVLLDPIGDGLTIVSGDNEEGKSTILAALKCALFEHHAAVGAVREAMTPQGTSLVPEVEVDFAIDGQDWQLRKAFRRGGAELVSGTQRLSGDAAEDRLLELLRFQRRRRGDARPEHHGLAALFWVDQGTSFAGFAPLAAGRDRIAAAVAGELGALTGGAEAAMLAAAVRERCDRYWSPTFKEKGPLKEAVERLVALTAEVGVLRARVGELAGKEERLARLRDARQRAVETEALVQARARRDESRRRLEGIAGLDRQAALATERLKAGRAGLAQVEAAAEQRRRSRADLAADAAALRQAAVTLDDRRADVAKTAGGRDDAERGDRQARAAVVAAEAELERCRRALQAADRARELQRLEVSLTTARAAALAVASLRARLESEPATEQRIAAMRAAQGAHDRAAAALTAAATTLELHPAAGRTASRDGVPLDSAAPLELTDRTTLELAGWGRLVVLPGGADIAARRGAAAAALDRLGETLLGLGAATVAEAEHRAAARVALERDADAARTRLTAAIEGAGHASVDELAARVAALGGPEGSDVAVELDPAMTPAMVAAAAESLATLRLAAEATFASLRVAESQAVEARQRAALVDQEARRLDGVVAAGRLQLKAAEAERDDEALIGAVEAVRGTCLALEGEAERLAKELRLADGETVTARLTMAEREIAQLEAERAQRERMIVELESELRAVGEDGLGERLDEEEGRLALAGAELGRMRREALAWKMLHEALDRAVWADRQALLAPVVARLAPWLGRLFPDAAPILDPYSLAPAGLARAGIEESFDSLSLGTREQLAILVRLGVASLLAEREGEAPCLILDDALVYADEGRFETMKTILQRAAREMQILVLTCRPRDYFGLDACYLRLDDCRVHELPR